MPARLTKLDMARVVVQALYNSDTPYPADHGEVAHMAKTMTVDRLRWRYDLAQKILADRDRGIVIMLRAAEIDRLERSGELDPNCPDCRRDWYPFYQNVWMPDGSASEPWAPKHKALCGGSSHCTCDRCF